MLENFRLRVFREVAAHASFRRAAEALYVSQPAVTQQIKLLEEELGVRVFDRSGGRVRLTPAGAALLRRAEESAGTLARAVEDVAALDGQWRGTLRVAASTTIAQYILPGMLAEFARQHPGVHLELESANTERVVTAVAEQQAELGLIEGPAHRPDLLVEPWLADELVLVVPSGHEWASADTLPLASVAAAPLLVRERGSGTRAVLEQALAGAGVELRSLSYAMELGSTETLLACVEAGLGVGFASRFALRRQLALGSLAIVSVAGLRVQRMLWLARQRGPTAWAAAEAFAAYLKSFAEAVAAERSRRERRPGNAGL